MDFDSALAASLEPDAIPLSIIADARSGQDQNIQKPTTAAAKPTVETKQTLLRELNSFLRPDGDTDAKVDEMFARWITEPLN